MNSNGRENMIEAPEVAPFFLVTNWDEALGPKIVLQYPSSKDIKLPDYNPLAFSTQIFMVASSLFGDQDYQKEIVDIPIVSFESRIRVRVVFDYKEVPESEVRGGRLPFMLIAGYPETPFHKKSLDKLQDELAKYLHHVITSTDLDTDLKRLEYFWSTVNNARFSNFETLDDFFDILNYFSRHVVFGLITGTIIRQNIPEQFTFERYLNDFKVEEYQPQTIGQFEIKEPYFEYWYCFWTGPFIIFLRQPLNRLNELNRFIKNIKEYTDHLWSLTLVDPHAEIFNLFSNISIHPKITGELYKLSHMSVTRLLSGSEHGFDNQYIKNPEILFYIRDQARECLDLYLEGELANGQLMISYLIDLKNIYIYNSWRGILASISYFIGELFMRKKAITTLSWYRTLIVFYEKFPGVFLKQSGRAIEISNCPFIGLDDSPGYFTFIRSFLLAQYPKYEFKFSLLDNDSFSILQK